MWKLKRTGMKSYTQYTAITRRLVCIYFLLFYCFICKCHLIFHEWKVCENDCGCDCDGYTQYTHTRIQYITF